MPDQSEFRLAARSGGLMARPLDDDSASTSSPSSPLDRDRRSDGRPPRFPASALVASIKVKTSSIVASRTVRRCFSTAKLACESPLPLEEGLESEESEEPGFDSGRIKEFVPAIRSGGWTDIGGRRYMEDAHVRIDDLMSHLGAIFSGDTHGAFYGVFDGHGGKDAANFVREHLLKHIIENESFPVMLDEAVRHAFLETDHAFAQACMVDEGLASGTTALMALVIGRKLLVANAGDCRAVLSKRGKAIEMSRDHKPCCPLERVRIESVGGFVDDGYLNGQLAVARALGDWHMEGLKEFGVDGPLSAEPEMQQISLTEEDEFLIIGCDGLWDVFTSQNAIDFARKKLQQHNDPELCSKELITEALRRNTSDNLTVLMICFHEEPPPRLSYTPVRRSISADCLRDLQGLLDGSLN